MCILVYVVMPAYTKLFHSILDSTIWRESKETRLVWVTILAMTDRDGMVLASVPGLADRAKVSLDECQVALKVMLGPDKWSRDKENEGRRLREVDGGWEVLNHRKYRELMSKEERREYNRGKQAEYRARTNAQERMRKIREKKEREEKQEAEVRLENRGAQ
jgi:hypothetical protein